VWDPEFIPQYLQKKKKEKEQKSTKKL
jgi:hypothetical protein